MNPVALPLADDEHVLWEGSPPTGLNLASHDATLVALSLFWMALIVTFNVAAWENKGNWFLRAWGAPFLLLGAYLVFGRFIADAWVRRRQRYFVTNRRIVILRRGWLGGSTALDIGWLPPVTKIERADGSGDLRFGLPRHGTGKSGRKYEKDRWAPALSPVPHFIGVADIATVHGLIERTARA